MAAAVKNISVKAITLKNIQTLVRVSESENFSSNVTSFSTTNLNLLRKFLFCFVFIFSAMCSVQWALLWLCFLLFLPKQNIFVAYQLNKPR